MLMVEPSCPALVIHDDDEFRRNLIRTLDQEHFTVTFTNDGPGAVEALGTRRFNVVIVGLDLKSKIGVTAIEHLRTHREQLACGVIIVGEPDPALRTYAPWADETFLKPVDPGYLATRARGYCGC